MRDKQLPAYFAYLVYHLRVCPLPTTLPQLLGFVLQQVGDQRETARGQHGDGELIWRVYGQRGRLDGVLEAFLQTQNEHLQARLWDLWSEAVHVVVVFVIAM